MELEDLPYKFLQEITYGFSEERKLGEGAFGVVYKGVTKTGEDVAVKKLKLHCDNLDYKEFQNELNNLRILEHQNIVQVLGYCYEIQQKPYTMPDGSKVFVDEPFIALCLEYMHNGSLQKHLSAEFNGLDWDTRFKIVQGTCEGVRYIHEELQAPIYHLDLKPDNILLDKDMMPKIADFGLSRIFHEEPTRITNRPYGTPGYQPPEYIDRGEISGKFDIFSLGVVIIRIVSGPESYPKCLYMPSDEFIDQVQKNWRKRLQATSSSDSLLEAYCHQVVTCTQIALNCLDNDSKKRPDIVSITEKLNEIETDIVKDCIIAWLFLALGVEECSSNGPAFWLHQKGCHNPVSKLKMHNNKIEVREWPKDITGSNQNINLMSSPSFSNVELFDARETSSDVVEELIVGRTEEKEKIMTSLLLVMSENLVILPIHGIGGIGKTTFARLIYNDTKFRYYSHVWVNVSQRFDLNKIGESIISQLCEKESQANERQMTHSCLMKLLSGKKIIIVLDDLWEDNHFQLQELKDVLYHDQSNIIILVTTRSERVALRVCSNLQPYKILPLTNDMCWDIIKQRSGFETRDDKEQLTSIGQEIARKCGGVPLAARSLGFTLRNMNFDQWMKVKDDEIWNEPVLGDASLPNQVLASLMLSYSYMAPCLKMCFTYCAIFPKGHKIVKEDLIYQWISLGYIKTTQLLSILQICEKYIMQLLGLSFIQLYPKSSDLYHEQVKIFSMHDLVHDLAISLLGNQVLDQSKQGNSRGSSCQYALLADCSKPLELCLTSRARLIAVRFLDCRSTELRGAAFAPARSLRVLDLSECSIHKLPQSIGLLRQLRYLNAPGVQDRMLPESITDLSHLIYLNIQGSSTISALPESIGKMASLIHLDLSRCNGIYQLPVSFRNLENLVHLNLSGCYNMSGVTASLGSLRRLEHLSLYCCMIDGNLAKALGGLTELRSLNLSRVVCSGNHCEGLGQVLVNLSKLRYLNIQDFLDKAGGDSFLEFIIRLSKLEHLDLSSNHNLCSIPEAIENLSSLQTLDVSHCINLERLPASISGIDSLKFLNVASCYMLDESTLPQYYKNSAMLLPRFVVHSGYGESSSNLFQLEFENPTVLEINKLENVKSAEEAQRIKLVDKQNIQDLTLLWTRDAERFVDDTELLKRLVPPPSVQNFRLEGYTSISFPSWMMDIVIYLPHLVEIILYDLPNCNNLPPLGQLPNLKSLCIGGMDSIRKIDQDLYGGIRAFPQLYSIQLTDMKCLEDWNTSYPSPSGEDGLNEVVFPTLNYIEITNCPKVRYKQSSPLTKRMVINGSDQVILSSWEFRGHVGASFLAATTELYVGHCAAPLHQWRLLLHLPYLNSLEIIQCSDLTCSSDLLPCLASLKTISFKDSKFVETLPDWLGDLTSLKTLAITDCEGIKALPKSIQQLTCLQRLKIDGCPELVQLPYLPSVESLLLRQCNTIAELPERLGDHTSLKELSLVNCEGIKTLPESIQQITCFQHLTINACPELVQWFKSEENKMNLPQIKEITLDYVRLST